MKFGRRIRAAGVALGFAAMTAAATPGPAGAQTMAVAGSVTSTKKIQVNRCDPQRQVSTTSVGGPYMGFSPGFYGRGPYYWDDAYGFPYYQAPLAVNQSGTLSIDYMNVTTVVMRTIEFGLVANGRLVAEVRDVGTFSPHAEIKHQFGLNPNVFPLQTALPHCIPLRITFNDGSQWTNKHLPALQQAIYGRPTNY